MSIFHASETPFINFCQLSVRPRELPSTSVNFLSSSWTFRKLYSTFRAAAVTSVNFSCIHGIFCKFSVPTGTFRRLLQTFRLRNHPSTFRALAAPSVNFREHSVRPQDILSIFYSTVGSSINFSQLSV